MTAVHDFCHQAYRDLLTTLLAAGYRAIPVREAPASPPEGAQIVVLRHDVDRLPFRALALARLEKDLGVRSTYFFRTKPLLRPPSVLRAIHGMGHEVGYHYENLADTRGDAEAAWADFERRLTELRRVVPVESVAMHGRPLSPHDNRDLWKTHDYRRAGIRREAYADLDWTRYRYFTDVGGRWDAGRENLRDRVGAEGNGFQPRSTAELARTLTEKPGPAVVSTHPERWPSSLVGRVQARAFDAAVGEVKKLLLAFRKHGVA